MVVRTVGQDMTSDSFVKEIATIDLRDKAVFNQVKADYETVRRMLKEFPDGFLRLSGRMGVYIQPRTKGAGHGSVSRAFYARKNFLSIFIKSI